MTSPRMERLAAATGIAFVLLTVAGMVMIGNAGGDTSDPAATVSQRLLDNDAPVYAGAMLALAGSAALLWFAGSLRSALRRAEGDPGRLSGVAFGAAIAHAGILIIGIVLSAAAVFELADYQNSPDTARAVYALGGILAFLATSSPFGVMLLAGSVVGLRTGVLPGWLSWPGAIVGVIMAIGGFIWPIAVFGHLIAFIWTLVVSVILIRRAGTASDLD